MTDKHASHASEDNRVGTGFFTIDRRAWARVCELGMNQAVAYLVLAQGTGGDNRTTRWSVSSLKRYMGISWERGQSAIQDLVAAGLVGHAKNHSSNRPCYELLSWAEFFPADLERRIAQLSGWHKKALTGFQTHGFPAKPTKDQLNDLKQLCEREVLYWSGTQYSLEVPPEGPDLIWLPNTLVTGTLNGEESPVRRLRSAGDIWALRLLVDLYHAQNLCDDGGISPLILWEKYERKLVGEQGICNVWAFKSSGPFLSLCGPLAGHAKRAKREGAREPVCDSVAQLLELGLLTFVPHLWENESGQAEVLHPYGIEGVGGEHAEVEIGRAAHLAGNAMCWDSRLEAAFGTSEEEYVPWKLESCLAPVQKTLPNVSMIGVGRLSYRPHTRRTSIWLSELKKLRQFGFESITNCASAPNKLPSEHNK